MTASPPHRIAVDDELTIITAAEYNRRLAAALSDGAPVEVCLAGVTDLDTAGLQVLLHARREAHRLGRTVTFRDLNEVVRDTLAVAHLDGVLDGTAQTVTGRSEA
ncbi:hypothetical protein GCM10010466_46570 [Planomonospora alba]|uniref:STAS domain-containing protein n=1 Tax=Planomonospora alba TaxID=161354 RepID=A0ABP6NJ13_9ACTN